MRVKFIASTFWDGFFEQKLLKDFGDFEVRDLSFSGLYAAWLQLDYSVLVILLD